MKENSVMGIVRFNLFIIHMYVDLLRLCGSSRATYLNLLHHDLEPCFNCGWNYNVDNWLTVATSMSDFLIVSKMLDWR